MKTPAKNRLANPGWFLVSPSVALLLLWMIVPLGMTLYFSLIRYNLLYPGENEFVGLENFTYFITDSGFLPGATNTLLLVGSVLLISVVFGVLISVLLEASEFFGRGLVRVLLISPFFIMPTVGALIWKNLIFHPVSGCSPPCGNCSAPSRWTGWRITRCCRSSSLCRGNGCPSRSCC